ncbi:glycosyltransferase family 32 protein [uncultured Massilia sp.]|uniref:glycosyltransferase family 32 protein n=1 Tax=uncultured Massilia sp. TaxID=169973 RepID=UPI0025864078|nr:glycosyltransferase [uncultured Massilia sp.]
MSIKRLLIPQLNTAPTQELIPELPVGTSIPRIIHQIGTRPAFQNKQLPEILQANVDHLRAMNPGWEYRFYDDDDIADFLHEHYSPQVKDYYERIDTKYGAARADLFRYLLMYKVGGVYLDIKSSTTLPLDDLIRPDDRYIVSQWHTADGQYAAWGELHDVRHVVGGEYQQWHIVCAPGHPYLKAVIEQVLSNIGKYDPHLHQTGKNGVLRLTGPVPYTVAIERILSHHPHRLLKGHDQLGFQYSVYSGSQQNHEKIFKGHYISQSASIIRLGTLRQPLSQAYRLAQYCHDRLQNYRASRSSKNQTG